MQYPALVEKLLVAGVDRALPELLQDYLSNRYLSVVLNGHQSSMQTAGAGVPHGSALGS